ncbi:site-specific integrase [Desulfosporosinus nitroreducens]|uniref:Site-specific integrase n=1 Tax=Desulfosporosinus nitroreducens TaxID=2018668 RepID=A0ABT8QVK9_9FIRM|nr:site-specific integrase [Desulfosporosinus nitroreducens]MDO0825380.1 site-specific integrase [Desulfosporosinus nitroreducens]
MKVEEIITKGNKRRYILLDSQDEPIEPVIYFLRFKDNNNSARSTLRTYCYHLKLYFEFLEQKRLDYRNVSLENLAEFMNWLKNPIGVANVTTISP